MSHYLIATLDIVDRETYAQYEAGFMDVFSRYEGKMLAVDEKPRLLEGQWGWTRTVLIEFPDAEKALAWFQSDEYQAIAQHRHAASSGNVVMIQCLP